GDTPPAERGLVRRYARIVLSNPDMVHYGMLDTHTRWTELFAHLAYVVVDEAHTLRGVFGSHIGCILRRLRRVARHYGSDPRFILTSATIGNPGDLAERLVGVPFTEVSGDGSPRDLRPHPGLPGGVPGGRAAGDRAGAVLGGAPRRGRNDCPGARRRHRGPRRRRDERVPRHGCPGVAAGGPGRAVAPGVGGGAGGP